jgi:hypothetical protein
VARAPRLFAFPPDVIEIEPGVAPGFLSRLISEPFDLTSDS